MKIDNIADIKPSTQWTVFVTGVTGQDGSHMVDYLLHNTDARVIGGARRLSVENHENIKHLENENRFQLVNFDLTDSHSIYKVIEYAKPNYFINFAAQTFVASSWDFARQTWESNTTAVLDSLEAIRRLDPECRFYNAGSSEEFGDVLSEPQDENTQLRPRSPYGASKAASRQLIKVYRESYDLYAVQGWLFNHEGSRRGAEFVTRKITKGVARIRKAMHDGVSFEPIELGNVDARRDWSDAEDMVDAVWRMMNQDRYNITWLPTNPETQKWTRDRKALVEQIKEYVVSSNESHTIREFVYEAFKAADIDGCWVNPTKEPTKETFRTGPHTDKVLVRINPKFYRPAEIEILRGDSSKIRDELGWKPKTDFGQLVEKMVQSDLTQAFA